MPLFCSLLSPLSSPLFSQVRFHLSLHWPDVGHRGVLGVSFAFFFSV